MPDFFIRYINDQMIAIIDGDGNELWRGRVVVLECLKRLSELGYIGSIYEEEMYS